MPITYYNRQNARELLFKLDAWNARLPALGHTLTVAFAYSPKVLLVTKLRPDLYSVQFELPTVGAQAGR